MPGATRGGIPYPVDSDKADGGAAAIKAFADFLDPENILANNRTGFRPLIHDGAVLGGAAAGDNVIVGPPIFRTWRNSANTTAAGEFTVALPAGIFTRVFGIWLTDLSGACLVFSIKPGTATTTSVTALCYNPVTATVLGNRAMNYCALAVGI